MEEFSIKIQLQRYKSLFVCDERQRNYLSIAVQILLHAFTYENHAMTTFQLFTDMRWFRGHAEAPRLLRLSPLRADEDVNEVSYHFRTRSRCRGKNRFK